jgi:hypothetical protein
MSATQQKTLAKCIEDAMAALQHEKENYEPRDTRWQVIEGKLDVYDKVWRSLQEGVCYV